MHSVQNTAYADAYFLLEALKGWLISALIFLVIASIYISRFNAEYETVGYISSAISFMAAFCAGARAAKCRKTGEIYTALVSATAITTLLLTIGFIIAGKNLPSSGVLSVVSFTFTGCAAGSIFGKGGNNKKHKKNRHKFT